MNACINFQRMLLSFLATVMHFNAHLVEAGKSMVYTVMEISTGYFRGRNKRKFVLKWSWEIYSAWKS